MNAIFETEEGRVFSDELLGPLGEPLPTTITYHGKIFHAIALTDPNPRSGEFISLFIEIGNSSPDNQSAGS